MIDGLPDHIHYLNELHKKWLPHAGQIPMIQDLFFYYIREMFLECGRNYGKTELIDYALSRRSISTANSRNYLIYPLQTQAREVVWKSNRLQNMLPPGCIKAINNTEMRITLWNDAFMKLDGSDNVDKYRGVKITDGSFYVYDEFKDFRPEFHEAVKPNLIDAYLMMAGTPPENFIEGETQFCVEADECRDNPEKRHHIGTAYDNPHIPRKMIEDEKTRLYRRGDGHIFEREWLARRVKGGKSSILPMFSRKMVRPWDDIMTELRRDLHKLNYYCIADPGSTTCFAVLFIAVNPWTKKVYVLDEIYEKDQKKTTAKQIGKRIVEQIKPYYARADWLYGYDEAAAWFQNEITGAKEFDMAFFPTHKKEWGKQNNEEKPFLSLMKDIMLADLLVVSDKCEGFILECENYIKDKNGKIPKGNDHTIDIFRYFLGMSYYSLDEKIEPRLPKKLQQLVKRIDRNTIKNDDLSDDYYHDDGSSDLITIEEY